jgi:hypothetical protein
MSTPTLPPYLGSYEELGHRPVHRLQADEVALNPQPLPPGSLVAEPNPDSWRSPAVRYLATLASVKELGATMGSEKGQHVVAAAEREFRLFWMIFRGTPARRIPWPWPGPPPWVLPLASEIMSVAKFAVGSFPGSPHADCRSRRRCGHSKGAGKPASSCRIVCSER